MLAYFHALIQVNNDLQTIGALAGLAAIPGLAVLSLLYFGQAREVRRLREWAGRAPERAAELEARVSAEAQRRVQTQPGQAAPPPATAAATPAGAQAAPVGNGVAQGKPAEPATAAAAAQAAGAEAKPDGDGAEKKEGDGAAKPEEAKAAGAEAKKPEDAEKAEKGE